MLRHKNKVSVQAQSKSPRASSALNFQIKCTPRTASGAERELH